MWRVTFRLFTGTVFRQQMYDRNVTVHIVRTNETHRSIATQIGHSHGMVWFEHQIMYLSLITPIRFFQQRPSFEHSQKKNNDILRHSNSNGPRLRTQSSHTPLLCRYPTIILLTSLPLLPPSFLPPSLPPSFPPSLSIDLRFVIDETAMARFCQVKVSFRAIQLLDPLRLTFCWDSDVILICILQSLRSCGRKSIWEGPKLIFLSIATEA